MELKAYLGEFQKAIMDKWTVVAVPNGINEFLKEHAPTVAVPKAKSERIRAFWDTVRDMD